MERIYSAALVARKEGVLSVSTGAVRAESPQAADGWALDLCRAKYPQKDGYTDHQVYTMLVPVVWVQAQADAERDGRV